MQRPSFDASKDPAPRGAPGLKAVCKDDTDFDRLLPFNLRVISQRFWTPFDVATQAASWLTEQSVRTVVDVGSGVGKFCVAAALGSRCTFTGIEQNSRLVSVAQDLAHHFNVHDRVRFITGTFGQVAPPQADCYYLFNPFEEHPLDPHERFNELPSLSPTRCLSDITMAERFLGSVPVGTYLLTYNGFGGNVPRDFEEIRVALEFPCVLRLSRRKRASSVSLP